MITFWGIVFGRSLIHGEWGRLYSNGIRSWQQLDPTPEIIMFGTEDFHEAECEALGIRYLPAPVDDKGIPLVNKCVDTIEMHANYPVRVYLCPDLILDQDFVVAMRYCSHFLRGFLAVGRRFDVPVPERLDFVNGQVSALADRAKTEGKLEHGNVVAYLAYTHHIWPDMPDFRCNHGVYDNYMVWESIRIGFPVIDVTGLCTVVHQSHQEHWDYGKSDRINHDLKPEAMFFAGSQSAAFITHRGMVNPTYTINEDERWVGQFDCVMTIQADDGSQKLGVILVDK